MALKHTIQVLPLLIVAAAPAAAAISDRALIADFPLRRHDEH